MSANEYLNCKVWFQGHAWLCNESAWPIGPNEVGCTEMSVGPVFSPSDEFFKTELMIDDREFFNYLQRFSVYRRLLKVTAQFVNMLKIHRKPHKFLTCEELKNC